LKSGSSAEQEMRVEARAMRRVLAVMGGGLVEIRRTRKDRGVNPNLRDGGGEGEGPRSWWMWGLWLIRDGGIFTEETPSARSRTDGKGFVWDGDSESGGGLSGVSLANFAVPIFPIRASSIKQ
jgi:hypothetical protein